MFRRFNVHSVVDDLDRVGAVSLPLLFHDWARLWLVEEAVRCSYTKRESLVRPSGVYQEVSGIDNEFPTGSRFHLFRNEWQKFLTEHLVEWGYQELFSKPLEFNDLSLQQYEAGSKGISPHLDHRDYINLICIFSLIGTCRFYICKDRKGNEPISLNADPGSVIFMRAPGFKGSDYRPFHAVRDIPDVRISFSLRQK